MRNLQGKADKSRLFPFRKNTGDMDEPAAWTRKDITSPETKNLVSHRGFTMAYSECLVMRISLPSTIYMEAANKAGATRIRRLWST